MENERKLSYIKDCEIDLSEQNNDFLQTRFYADTILRMVESAFTPFTIALFGGWGSGKSSIVKTIEKNLNNSSKGKVKIFIYDAWKYSEDSFKRTFILKLREKFKLKQSDEFENFYTDKHKEITKEIGIIGKWWLLAGFSFLALISIAFLHFRGESYVAPAIASFIALIPILLGNMITRYKSSMTTPRIFAPEQFEKLFSKTVDQIIGKNQHVYNRIKNSLNPHHQEDKLVIVMDNIDRCDGDLAVRLLLSIKNFLEKNGVIFLIPIGEEEIKEHLTDKGYDANEFLRKFFNTTLNIKKFSATDLREYAKQLTKKHNIDLPDDAISLVEQKFSKTPRKIIQFLNILQAEILLLKEQEKCGNIPESVAANLPFLTKILLIREEWFDLYKLLRNNPYLLDDINEVLKREEKDKFYELIETKKDDNMHKDKLRFLQRTRHITTETPELYFANKDSFPGVPDELYQWVISDDWETIKEKLNRGDVKFDNFIEFIDSIFDRDVIDRRRVRTTGFNILSLVLKVADDQDFSARFREIYCSASNRLGDIKAYFNSERIRNLVNQFEPKRLIAFIKIYPDENKELLDATVQFINDSETDSEDIHEILKEYIHTFEGNLQHLNKVGVRFSQAVLDNPKYFYEFEDVLKNKEVTDILIKGNLFRGLIDTLVGNPHQNHFQIETIKQLQNSRNFSVALLEEYVNKVGGFLLGAENQESKFWLEALDGFIPKISNEETWTTVYSALNSKFDFLQSNYPQQHDGLLNFLNISADLYRKTKNADLRKSICSWLEYFFSTSEEDRIYLHIIKIFSQFVSRFEVHNWPYSQVVIEKLNAVPEWEDKKQLIEVLDSMVKETEKEKGLSPEQLEQIFTIYIGLFDSGTPGEKNEVLAWVKSFADNPTAKQVAEGIIVGFDFLLKLDRIEIIKLLGSDHLEKAVEEIILNVEYTRLEEVTNKLISCKVDKGIIRKFLKSLLNPLVETDDVERFLHILDFVAGSEIKDTELTSIVADKLRSSFSGKSGREAVIPLLAILDKLDNIEKGQKAYLKTIANGLGISDFGAEDKQLLKKVRDKLQ